VTENAPETSGQEQAGQWKLGQSGNPAGRPPGTGAIAKLRASVAEHVPEIVMRLVYQAKTGDVGAARLLLEHVPPPMKASEQEAPIALPAGSLTDQGRALMAAAELGTSRPARRPSCLPGWPRWRRAMTSQKRSSSSACSRRSSPYRRGAFRAS
jgi:hypothetical protein